VGLLGAGISPHRGAQKRLRHDCCVCVRPPSPLVEMGQTPDQPRWPATTAVCSLQHRLLL